MGYAKLDRAGTWTYYECKSCFLKHWYHESDPKKCKRCGKEALVQMPPAKTKEEDDERSRQLGLW